MELRGEKGKLSCPMMTAEPSRKKRDSSYCLARAWPTRDGHNPANEKPLYLELSLPPVDSNDHSPPTSLFPSLKELSSHCYGGTWMCLTMVVDSKLQLFVDPEKTHFSGEITGSLSVVDRHFVAPTGIQRRLLTVPRLVREQVHYPHWAHWCSLLCSPTRGFKGKCFSWIWASALFAFWSSPGFMWNLFLKVFPF